LQKLSIEANLRRGSDPLKFTLKWPNDVLAERQKLSGILLEAEAVAGNRLAVVVGIGTNVVAAPEGTPTPAISLAALGVHVGAEELFSALVRMAWVEFRGIWDNGTRLCRDPQIVGWNAPLALAKPVRDPKRQRDRQRHVSTPSMKPACLIIRTSDGKTPPDRRGRGLFWLGGLRGSCLMARPDELTFAPLGGVGEIGMNLSIYGLGNRHQRAWLAVDLGVSFGDEEHLPGIDLIMPDIRFLEKERKNLMGPGG